MITNEVQEIQLDSKSNFNLTRKVLITILFICFGISLSLILSSGDSSIRIFGILSVLVVSILLLVVTLYNFVEVDNNTVAFIGSIIIILFSSLSSVKSTGERVKHGYYNGTTVITKTDTLVADSSFLYIGKTSSHIFFYDKSKFQEIVIPESEITKLLIKRGFQGNNLNYKK